MNVISHNVTSDISGLGKLYELLSLTLRLDTTHIYQTHIDGSTPTIGGISYVTATPQQVRAAVHQFLHPLRAPQRVAGGGPARAASRTAGPAGAGTSATRQAKASKTVITDTPSHVAAWRALQKASRLPLYLPARLPGGLGYDQFRAYRVPTRSGEARAAVAVGTTPQGGVWDVQAIAWAGAPILASPDASVTRGGRSYSLYYDGARLHMVAWKAGRVAYWVVNTLDDELSNGTMLALATTSVRVP